MLRLYVYVGQEDGDTFWQSVNIEEIDYERNATEIFREIAPLIEAAARDNSIRKTKISGAAPPWSGSTA